MWAMKEHSAARWQRERQGRRLETGTVAGALRSSAGRREDAGWEVQVRVSGMGNGGAVQRFNRLRADKG